MDGRRGSSLFKYLVLWLERRPAVLGYFWSVSLLWSILGSDVSPCLSAIVEASSCLLKRVTF